MPLTMPDSEAARSLLAAATSWPASTSAERDEVASRACEIADYDRPTPAECCQSSVDTSKACISVSTRRSASSGSAIPD